MTPNVTIIIATYNRCELLKEAIESVLMQTYHDFELIVIDDGSTDDSNKMVASINDPRITYLYQENHGRSHARNRGLQLAKGKYIGFLDSDDLFLPDKLQLQVDYLNNNPNIGMIYTSALCIDKKGNSILPNYIASVSGNIYLKIAFFVPVTITLPTVMVRREIFTSVGGFDEKMDRFEDTDMWRRISKITKIAAIDTYTCKLRTHDGNHLLTQDPTQIVAAVNYYARKILIEDKNVNFLSRCRGISCLYSYYATALLSVDQWQPHGYDLLYKSYCFWPIRIPVLILKKIYKKFFQSKKVPLAS